MSQFETRNWAHQWKFGTRITRCTVCQCPDMVELCAEYHDAGCKCTNPPCPLTEEERVKVEAALSEITNKKDNYNLGNISITTTPVVVERPYWATPGTATPTTKFGPTFGFTKWEVSDSITMMEQGVDLMTHAHVFRCNCKQHGDFTVKVSLDATAALMTYDDIRVHLARVIAGSCQGCTTRRSAIVRIADQAIGGGKRAVSQPNH